MLAKPAASRSWRAASRGSCTPRHRARWRGGWRRVGDGARSPVMIRKIHIRNFKCLRDIDVELGPFNVLIGPNDSGKTSFLEAILVLAKSVMTTRGGKPLSAFVNLDDLVWQHDKSLKIQYDIAGNARRAFNYQISLSP